MSALPKAVQKKIDEANRLADEIAKARNGETPPAGDPPAGNPPVGDPPSPPQGAAPPAGSPAPAQLPLEEWEHRYRVLQGKYNAEVPRLTKQANEQAEFIRDMRQQLTATQNLLASLSQQQATPPVKPPAQPAKLVKDEEVKEFGADLLDVMRRVAREEQASLVPEIERRIQPIAQRVEQATQVAGNAARQVATNSEQSVLDFLASKVPTWAQLDVDQGFLDWLDQVDPFSGAKRGVLLNQAFKAHDGPRVVAFFDGYLKEHATVTPPAPPAASATPPAQPQRKLEEFVAPGSPKPGAAVAPDGSGKRAWSRAEIGKFYADKSAGRIRDPKEAAKIEADIFAAQREGRIR